MRQNRLLSLGLLAAAMMPAGVISNVNVSGAGTGGGTASVLLGPPPLINNDNEFGPSFNTLQVGLNLTSMGVLTTTLSGPATGGVTEYSASVQLTNNSGLLLTGWEFGLPGDPYDFDFPTFDVAPSASNGWTVAVLTDRILRFQGAALLPGQQVVFSFGLDYPDGATILTGTPIPGTETPEPATWGLMAAAAIGGMLKVLRRKLLDGLWVGHDERVRGIAEQDGAAGFLR